jgi:hypothetical protein
MFGDAVVLRRVAARARARAVHRLRAARSPPWRALQKRSAVEASLPASGEAMIGLCAHWRRTDARGATCFLSRVRGPIALCRACDSFSKEVRRAEVKQALTLLDDFEELEPLL